MSEECKCGTQFCKHHKAQVWSCGGGTQSCAIAALIVQGKLPKPDFSVIADTGYETGATWEFMGRVLVPELAKVGVKLVRVSGEKFGRFWMQTFAKNADEPMIPAISLETGEPVRLRNICTFMWKIEVVERWLSRTHRITKSKRRLWIGFSFDEPIRILKKTTQREITAGRTWIPLNGLGMRRRDCVKIVENMGWGTPPRSACWMCPNHSDLEWRKLRRERPSEFEKAVEFEREIQKRDPDVWLHKTCVPLDQVDFSQPEDLFTRACDSGLCFV